MSRKSRFSEQQIAEMASMYARGETTTRIGEVYGIQRGTVYGLLAARGVHMLSRSEAKIIYSMRHDAFREIVDGSTAYWFGFLCADGCVSRTKWSRYIKLWLAVKDRTHIEAFRSFLGANHPVRENASRGSVGVDLISNIMFDDLVRHGCVERKSAGMACPIIRPDLVSHFVRGVFDGDGSAYFGGGSPTISFAGCPEFLTGLRDLIDGQIVCDGKLYPHCRGKLWYLIYRGQFKVAVFREWLYREATVWLPRKRERLESYPAGKRSGYPTASRYGAISTAGNVSSETIARYIAEQNTRD